jgi:hypothetical protein
MNPIQVIPPTLLFPPTALGSSSHEAIEVKNNTVGPLIVDAQAHSIGTGIDEFFISPASATIQSGQSYFFSSTFRPNTIGSKTGVVHIMPQGYPANNVDVSLSGTSAYAILKWQPFALDDLVPQKLQDAAAQLSGFMSLIINVLNFMSGLLSTLKALIIDFSDPLIVLIQAAQALTKDLLNDLSKTGLYYLQIMPTDARINPDKYPEIFKGVKIKNTVFDYEGIDVFNSIKGGSKTFINKIVLSFDDAADSRRPKFSSTMSAGCLIIAMDSGDVFKMVDLLVKLTRVLQLEFKAKFSPPTNLAAIAGNQRVKLTFTGNGGLLPNAFLIFRSDTAGGELILDTDANGRIVYRTDTFGRFVKRYKLIGVTTMVEQLMNVFHISESEATNMFAAAAYNIKGLIANLERAISLKFSYDDTNLQNDKSYSYVIASASIDESVNTNTILQNVNYSDSLFATKGMNTNGNEKDYPALRSDSTVNRNDPTDPSMGPTHIYGAGEFSTEINVTPKSLFSANITGQNRCRNYRCTHETEMTESFKFIIKTNTLKHYPILSTLVIINKSKDNEEILRTQYSVQQNESGGAILTFNDQAAQPNDLLQATYNYRSAGSAKHIFEDVRVALEASENTTTIHTQQKLLVQNSIRFIVSEASPWTSPVYSRIDVVISFVDELNGTIQVKVPTHFQKMAYHFEIEYQYYALPDMVFRCVNSEFNSYYFDVEACDDGTTLCPGFENRTCIYNAGTACTNTDNSQRLILRRREVSDTSGGEGEATGIQAENIPFKEFYDPIYCQLGITAQRCDGYSKTDPRSGYKGTPPDWQSTSIGDLFPPIYNLIKLIDDFLTTLLKSLQGMTQAVLDFINLIQQKITDLTDLLTRIKSYLDILAYDFKGGGFYLLNVPPQTGGNTYLKQAIENSTKGPSSDETGFTAGVVIAYGGPSATAIANSLKAIFG